MWPDGWGSGARGSRASAGPARCVRRMKPDGAVLSNCSCARSCLRTSGSCRGDPRPPRPWEPALRPWGRGGAGPVLVALCLHVRLCVRAARPPAGSCREGERREQVFLCWSAQPLLMREDNETRAVPSWRPRWSGTPGRSHRPCSSSGSLSDGSGDTLPMWLLGRAWLLAPAQPRERGRPGGDQVCGGHTRPPGLAHRPPGVGSECYKSDRCVQLPEPGPQHPAPSLPDGATAEVSRDLMRSCCLYLYLD